MEDGNVLKSSQFGRPVPKPEVPKNVEVEMEKFFDDYDDASHVEARMEHMKTKLLLIRRSKLALVLDILKCSLRNACPAT
jgi:hypothetical protein